MARSAHRGTVSLREPRRDGHGNQHKIGFLQRHFPVFSSFSNRAALGESHVGEQPDVLVNRQRAPQTQTTKDRKIKDRKIADRGRRVVLDVSGSSGSRPEKHRE